MTPEQMLLLLQSVLQPAVMLGFVGSLLSLAANYIPGLNEWFAGQGEKFKPLVMLGLITVIVLVLGGLSFGKVLPVVSPDLTGAFTLIIAWFSALVANQTTFTYTKSIRPARVMKAKAKAANLG